MCSKFCLEHMLQPYLESSKQHDNLVSSTKVLKTIHTKNYGRTSSDWKMYSCVWTTSSAHTTDSLVNWVKMCAFDWFNQKERIVLNYLPVYISEHKLTGSSAKSEKINESEMIEACVSVARIYQKIKTWVLKRGVWW